MTEAHSFELGTDGPAAIVVGIDGSTTSLRASAYAAGLARRQRAREPVTGLSGCPDYDGVGTNLPGDPVELRQ